MPSLPDFTPGQLAAWLATLVGAVVVLFKLDMTDAQQGALVTILVAAAVAFHFISDAVIRHGRATGIGIAMVNQAADLVPDAPPASEGKDTVAVQPLTTP